MNKPKVRLEYQSQEETFAEFLKRVRLTLGVPPNDFAKFLGVTESTLNRWMSGDTRYLHDATKEKWQDLGIHFPQVTTPKSVLEQLREEVESLTDARGKLLYSEADLADTLEWIRLFKQKKRRGRPRKAVSS